MFKETFFRNSWGHATNHIIMKKDGIEYIVEAGPREYYNPWLYSEELDPAIVKAIFGNKKFRPMPLHFAFANIDTENTAQIIAWCNHLGLPTFYQGKYDIDIFREYVTRFYLLFQVAGALQSGNKADIESALFVPFMLDAAAAIPANIKEEYRAMIRRDPEAMARKHISEKINHRMKENFWPEFQIDESNDIKLAWRTTSLLAVMNFMLGMNLTTNKFPLKCENKTCIQYFFPKNDKHIYCSYECKNHAQQTRFQQKWRMQRMENAINAYNGGASIKEAAKLYSVTVPALQKALQREGESK